MERSRIRAADRSCGVDGGQIELPHRPPPWRKPPCIVAILLTLFLLSCGGADDPCARITTIPRSECTALVAFYHATGGAHWKDQRGWLETRDPCTWFGVGCREGHVTSLSINFNDLRGSLPSELGPCPELVEGNLPHLQTLSLYYNHLSGPIPPELAACPGPGGGTSALETLILHNNQLSGPLPHELGQLSHLQHLDLDSNKLSGPLPPELGQLAELRALKLRDNQFSGSLPPDLGNLAQLEGLFLSSNDFSGGIPAEWGRLKHLRFLALYGNPVQGPLPAGLEHLPASGYELLWGGE